MVKENCLKEQYERKSIMVENGSQNQRLRPRPLNQFLQEKPAKWQQLLPLNFLKRLAINISQSLTDFTDFVAWLQSLIEKHVRRLKSVKTSKTTRLNLVKATFFSLQLRFKVHPKPFLIIFILQYFIHILTTSVIPCPMLQLLVILNFMQTSCHNVGSKKICHIHLSVKVNEYRGSSDNEEESLLQKMAIASLVRKRFVFVISLFFPIIKYDNTSHTIHTIYVRKV